MSTTGPSDPSPTRPRPAADAESPSPGRPLAGPGQSLEGSGVDLPTAIGAYVFFVAGGLLIVGGIVLTVQDPVGLLLVALGLVFLAAGRFARRISRATVGKRAVVLSEYEVGIRTVQGLRGTRRATQTVYLDEETAAAVTANPRDAWMHLVRDTRPDWVAGRILAEDDRHARGLDAAAVAWSVFALAALGAAHLWDGVAALVAVGAVPIAGILVGNAVLRRWHDRKFGASVLVLDRVPVVLGEVLTGRVESCIPASTAPPDGFSIALRCVHRWREYVRRPGDRQDRMYYHRDVLWEAKHVVPGEIDVGRGAVSVPVQFTLPADQPASTLVRSTEGISWELAVTAALEGLDYGVRLEIPVVAGEGGP